MDVCQWQHRQGGINVEVGKGGGATAAEVMDGTGSRRKELTSSFHMATATKTANNGQCNGGQCNGQGLVVILDGSICRI